MGLGVFLGDLAGIRYIVGCCVGDAVSGTCCYAVSLVGVWVASSCFLQFVEHQHKFVRVSKAIGFAPAYLYPCQLLPLPPIESEIIPKATINSFFEVVGCLVSSARLDGRCRPQSEIIPKATINSFFEVVGCLVSSARLDGRCRPLADKKKNTHIHTQTPIEPNEPPKTRT